MPLDGGIWQNYPIPRNSRRAQLDPTLSRNGHFSVRRPHPLPGVLREIEEAASLITGRADDYPHGWRVQPHSHTKHQLICAVRGVIVVQSAIGRWVVPPTRGIWIVGEDDALIPSLLTLSDVMGTGHHAAVVARVQPGKKVAVIGDGAVGLCGVIAAKRLGADQIIILGAHPDRIALARDFGATDVVRERGDAAVERVRKLTGGAGVHSVLECVGSEDAMRTAVLVTRAGGAIGRVGVPHYAGTPASQQAFYANISVGGGPAPVRAYIETLMPDILEGKIPPGRVFDRTVGLEGVPEGYQAMNARQSLKIMIRP
ncbi:MAG: zinc-binding dehydrogenase [Gammaproteobacteria bacterium]|nr:zinc-binding dehydrogenase [Gammaproteobacteria bacterium]